MTARKSTSLPKGRSLHLGRSSASRGLLRKPLGSYVLLIRLPAEETITVGRRGSLRFSAGHYAYVGSAMGGLDGRIERHLRRDKRRHWHIDYLLERASIDDVIACETATHSECAVAQALAEQLEAIPGFGASDCRCRGHLFFSREPPRSTAMAILGRLGMSPELWSSRRT